MLRTFFSRLHSLFRRRTLETEFESEVEDHIALLTERFVHQGMTPEEARYAAQRQFGGISQKKEELRDGRGFPLIERLLQDTRYIARQLRKSPVFTISAVLTLALGIGANTAIFTLVDQLILRLLPIHDPQQVVQLFEEGTFYGGNSGYHVLPYSLYQEIRDHNTIFASMMCRRAEQFTIGTAGRSRMVTGEVASGNYFAMLGIHASLGRVFTAQDDLRSGESPLVVVSHAFWVTGLGADRQIIGKTLRINNYAMTVIGVAQPGFDGIEPGVPKKIFVPVTMSLQLFSKDALSQLYGHLMRLVNVYGRLNPGVTRQQAQAALQPMFHAILDHEVRQPAFRNATTYDKAEFLKMRLNVITGSQGEATMRREFERPLKVLMVIVGLVLLIACSNLASLLTARAASRQREIAVRLALGSSRRRMIQQLLTEGLLLAIAGGVAGIAVAVVMVKGLVAFLPATISGYDLSTAVDWHMIGFSLVLAILTGFAFALLPALQSVQPNIADTLKDQATNVSGAGGQVTFRKLLVTAQISVSLLLLIGAGLFIHSLANLRALNPGFETKNLIQFGLAPESLNYSSDESHALFRKLESRLSALPEVRAVGVANVAVLTNDNWENGITVAGYAAKPGENMVPYFNAVTPGYFPALGIHLLAGRNFRPSDDKQSTQVAIVNKSFARYYFGDEPAVGRRIGKGTDPGTPTNIEIVGVVNDTKYESLKQSSPRQVFRPAAQSYEGYATVYVRTSQDPEPAFQTIRKTVHELDPNVPVTDLKTLDRQVSESLATERMIATLSTGFSILATLLAVVGLYGVMSYTVTRRAREIAIRIALGALKGNVIWLVMREVLLLVAVGIGIGLPIALGFSHFVQAELYGLEPTDPFSIGCATLLLSSVALLAGYIPARRAASRDPIRVLRYE